MRSGERPGRGAQGPAERPPDTSVRSGSNSLEEAGKYVGHRETEGSEREVGEKAQDTHTYFLHRSQLYMLSPRAVNADNGEQGQEMGAGVDVTIYAYETQPDRLPARESPRL